MARIFLTENLTAVEPARFAAVLQGILQHLQDQLNANPNLATLTSNGQSLPQGIQRGDVVFSIANGELQAGVYNGAQVVYASFGTITGAITDAQHGTRSGGNLHPNATPSVSGFMSGADKSKSDSFLGDVTGTVFPPTTTQFPAGSWGFYTNSISTLQYIVHNFAGSIKTTPMT